MIYKCAGCGDKFSCPDAERGVECAINIEFAGPKLHARDEVLKAFNEAKDGLCPVCTLATLRYLHGDPGLCRGVRIVNGRKP